jgi:phosphatidylinositol-3,4,5-trisphosphate 3-phosphatase and dual-specificity protein phosphatase PTEN
MENTQQEVKQQTESPSTSPTVRTAEKQEESSRTQEETPGIFSWARNLKIPQTAAAVPQDSPTGKSTFSRLTSSLSLRLSPKGAQTEEFTAEGTSSGAPNGGVLGTLTKGIVDTSKNAVKAVQVKARHMVSQNKRRYQVNYL